MRLRRRTKVERANDARSTFVRSRVIDLTETLALTILDVPHGEWPPRCLEIYDHVGGVLLHPEVQGSRGRPLQDAMEEFERFGRTIPNGHDHQATIEEGKQ